MKRSMHTGNCLQVKSMIHLGSRSQNAEDFITLQSENTPLQKDFLWWLVSGLGEENWKQSWDAALVGLTTQKKKKSGHRDNERLSTMCLGSVLVLGWGSWAEVGKCSCGFVWIMIRVLCGWKLHIHFVLLCGCICLCEHCLGGCATEAVLLFLLSSCFLPLSLPPFQGEGQQTGTDCPVLILVFFWSVGSHRWWWLARWKIRPGGYHRPT